MIRLTQSNPLPPPRQTEKKEDERYLCFSTSHNHDDELYLSHRVLVVALVSLFVPFFLFYSFTSVETLL
jgi:hypothetical protein